MTSINKLIIAAAGSGKTTFVVEEALKKHSEKVLITTYTIANELEIRKRIISLNKSIPENITIQTWFSFLLQHGVRPFQGQLFDKCITGMVLVNSQSGVKYKTKQGIPVCFKEEEELEQHYFTSARKIYSDKLSKFVVRVNEKSHGSVIDRLSRIYSFIFVDEVQDLAGYDLEILNLLFQSSTDVLLVGDPRQVTYLTHNEKKYQKYSNGKIREFVSTECKKAKCEIDEKTLNVSHRNNQQICTFSGLLYPEFSSCDSAQKIVTGHDGIFFVRSREAQAYLSFYKPIQLRLNRDTKGVYPEYPVLNFGESKGLSFDRVLIYPTVDMLNWVLNRKTSLADKTKAQLYVAITRARYSVGIIYDYADDSLVEGIINFTFNI